MDFSGLIGKQFKTYYHGIVTVYGVYLHDGQVHVICGQPGAQLHTTSLDSLGVPDNE